MLLFVYVVLLHSEADMWFDCGFGGKSTKIGIVDAKKVLIDLRYSAMQTFSHGALKCEKSKMAATRVAKF